VVFESYHTLNTKPVDSEWIGESLIKRAAVFNEIKGTVENVIIQIKGGLFAEFEGITNAAYGGAVIQNCIIDTTEMLLQVDEAHAKYNMSSTKVMLTNWNDNNARFSNCYANINSNNTVWRDTTGDPILCNNQTSANTVNCGYVTEYTKEDMIEYLTGKLSAEALELYATL
jgi:hypothetical protein